MAGAAPALLDRAEALPHGLAHGDASPTNLHEPGDGTVVAFDWSYGSLGPVGSDLGQLLAGRFDSGVAEPDDLPAIAETILDAFSGGLADEGYPAPSE
ncbi:MAG TPA: phosphotransferase [Candidatus Microthrix sp.]|nr:phosphotransferase [uncultured Candidatus Microthrix sp.]HMS46764.1 phosphotransferase [Candidatus Microthrix sp.]